jgi:hypothetical protein
MFKIILLLCLCMISICTDAHKKAYTQLFNEPNTGAILQEINFNYPFIVFKN